MAWADVPESVGASLTEVAVTTVVASVAAVVVPSSTERVKVVFSVAWGVLRLFVGSKTNCRMAVWAALVLLDANA